MAAERLQESLAEGDRARYHRRVAESLWSRLHLLPDLGDLPDGLQLVVEAVPEDADLKRDGAAPGRAGGASDAVLATNTSSLSVSELAAALHRPERFLGLHFFNPVPGIGTRRGRGRRVTDPDRRRAAHRLGRRCWARTA